MFRRIVIPLDGSPFAARAVPIGMSLATAAHADVQVLGVARSTGELPSMHRMIAADAKRAGVDLGDVEVRVHPHPIEVLLEVAAEDDTVLCFASHHRIEPVASMLHAVGSVLIEQARRPLVVVGPSTAGKSDGDVVAALDATGDAAPVLAVAAAWAARLRSPLRIVTVYEPVPADLRRPDHFSRGHGPPTDPALYLDDMRARVADVGLMSVDTVAVPDPVSAGGGLESHLADHPARLVVLGRRQAGHPTMSPGVARHLLHTSAAPLLLVNRTR